jgi:hypothetical protein
VIPTLFGLSENKHLRVSSKKESNRPLWGELVLFGGIGILKHLPSSDDFVSVTELKSQLSNLENPMVPLRSLNGENEDRHRQSNSKIWVNALEQLETSQSPSCAFSSLEIDSSSSGIISIGGLEKFLEESGELSRACAASLLALLVQQKGVADIHHRPPIFKSNEHGKSIIQTESFSTSFPYTNAGIDGRGQIVAVADTGLDELSCYFRNSDSSKVARSRYRNPTFDLSKRKVIQYIDYCDDTDTYRGHGTHVSGTVAGEVMGSNDATFQSENGHAAGAKIAFFDMEYSSSPERGLRHPTPFDEYVLTPAYNAGAFIHTNSWGTSWNFYDDRVISIDSFLFDHSNSLVLFAASNEGDEGYYSIGSPGVSKNALTVGATRSSSSNDINSLAYFSSLGPTYDNRIKPDVVAPGYYTISASSSGSEIETCAVTSMAGTSMATPAVRFLFSLCFFFLSFFEYFSS